MAPFSALLAASSLGLRWPEEVVGGLVSSMSDPASPLSSFGHVAVPREIWKGRRD